MTRALPPPGTYIKNYLTYYSASDFKDNNGDDLIPDFKLKVAAEVLRFIHVTDYKILGANGAVHAFIPLAYQDVTLGGRDDDRFGLGDIIVDPKKSEGGRHPCQSGPGAARKLFGMCLIFIENFHSYHKRAESPIHTESKQSIFPCNLLI